MIDLLLTGAKVVAMAPGPVGADAVAVRDGRIVAVGAARDLAGAAGPLTRRVDVAGGVLLPGFCDPHVHVWKVGRMRDALVDLRGAADLGEVRDLLRARADRLAPGEWLLARGVNELRLAERRLPDRATLDAWLGDTPALVTRACAHVAIANTAALRAAGLTAASADPPGGELRRDAAGRLTGVVTETAIAEVERAAPAPTAADYRAWIAAGLAALARHGVTAATDPGVDDGLVEVYQRMAGAEELPIRCRVMRLAPEGRAAAAENLPPPTRSEWLSVDTVKFFLDGGLSGATAAIRGPYRHAPTSGVLRMNAEEFVERIAPYASRGYAIAAHAIGDRAIDAGLEAFGRVHAPRKRLEHFGLPTEHALAEAARLGVIVVTQPQFLPELGPNFAAYLPSDFPITPYPFASMLGAGLTVAFSSDGPVVSDLRPLAGMQAAATRIACGAVLGPAERVSVQESLACYTRAGAVAEGDSAWRGTIEPGMAADLVLLDRDPTTIPAESLAEVRVQRVWVGGNEIGASEPLLRP